LKKKLQILSSPQAYEVAFGLAGLGLVAVIGGGAKCDSENGGTDAWLYEWHRAAESPGNQFFAAHK